MSLHLEEAVQSTTNSVLGLARALYPGGVTGRTLFVLSAYFDDSGTHIGSSNVTVGGFVADVAQWAEFERDWGNMLSDYGLEFFRMADYESRKGAYEPWGNEKRIEFIKRLTRII